MEQNEGQEDDSTRVMMVLNLTVCEIHVMKPDKTRDWIITYTQASFWKFYRHISVVLFTFTGFTVLL